MYGESELKQEWLHLDPTRSDSLKSIPTEGAGVKRRRHFELARGTEVGYAGGLRVREAVWLVGTFGGSLSWA